MKKLFVALLLVLAASLCYAAPSLVVDKEKGEIIVPAEVNGKYLVSPTKHALSFIEGGNGEKSVLRALVSELDFHQALLDLGAKPGDNIKMEDMKAKSSKEGKAAEGDKVAVFLTWEGSNGEVPLDDAIVSEVAGGTPRPLDLRFSGNLEFAKRNRPGCFVCLDSCAAGVVTNAAWPTGALNNREVSFRGNGEVLPPDGTPVSVIVRLTKPAL
ncbi:MAG: hypothetical protein IJ702_07595 [Fretibacterium sp.]|nr:hypothetical protein [Fretibacterium sp.]